MAVAVADSTLDLKRSVADGGGRCLSPEIWPLFRVEGAALWPLLPRLEKTSAARLPRGATLQHMGGGAPEASVCLHLPRRAPSKTPRRGACRQTCLQACQRQPGQTPICSHVGGGEHI